MSELDGTPEDRFSCVTAHIMIKGLPKYQGKENYVASLGPLVQNFWCSNTLNWRHRVTLLKNSLTCFEYSCLPVLEEVRHKPVCTVTEKS